MLILATVFTAFTTKHEVVRHVPQHIDMCAAIIMAYLAPRVGHLLWSGHAQYGDWCLVGSPKALKTKIATRVGIRVGHREAAEQPGCALWQRDHATGYKPVHGENVLLKKHCVLLQATHRASSRSSPTNGHL